MTVEEIRGVNNNEIDRFPIGMRVLAVDDNPTCLKVLDGLLRKCQYQVTTTNQAITALKMLRENRDRFDLIISDVYMPDMDGFKLLELVGLEMDLPVIMLSGNSDPKLVMKGIAHGACDYLVKPVRLQELQNVWQHVIRRKVESKSQSKSNNNNEKSDQGNESGDQNLKVNRKRKEEDEDNGNDSNDDDQTTQKKPRVVWSIDLHRKFVAAVNQLGIEKAMPKRILDFMNVDGLTRENVASHLQKYRLYLKRISHQANMVVAFGGNKDSYMRMNSLDGVGDFGTLSCSGRLSNVTYAPPGMLGRLNSATGVAHHSLTNHTQNKLQPLVSLTLPNHQNMNLFQPSFALDHQQYNNKPNTQLTDFSSIEESRIFTGTKLDDFSSVDESRMFTGSSAFTGPVPFLGSQPPSFSSKQLPIGENYSYSAIVNGGFGTTATVPLEAHVGSLVDDIVQNVNQNQKSGPCGKQDYNQYSQNAFSTPAFSALTSGGGLSGPVGHSRTNSGALTIVQTEKPCMRSSEDYVLDQAKLQGGFIASNGYGSLDDIMTGIMKREQDSTIIMGGEFGYDPYCFGQ